MATCREIRWQIDAKGGLAEPPASVREHLAGCPACARSLEVARLTSGLLQASLLAPEPPVGFAERVGVRLTAGSRRPADEGDLWRPAWGLVPTFAAILGVLLALAQGPVDSEPTDLLSTESVTLVEQLVLAPGEVSSDMVLELVLEGNGP